MYIYIYIYLCIYIHIQIHVQENCFHDSLKADKARLNAKAKPKYGQQIVVPARFGSHHVLDVHLHLHPLCLSFIRVHREQKKTKKNKGSSNPAPLPHAAEIFNLEFAGWNSTLKFNLEISTLKFRDWNWTLNLNLEIQKTSKCWIFKILSWNSMLNFQDSTLKSPNPTSIPLS